MVRPKLFLDTNICNYAADGSIPAAEWSRIRKHIGVRYRYCISFVTMKELFGRLARCSEEFFEDNKRSLHVLYGSGNRYFLPYPSSFAIQTVLGYPASRKSDTHNLSDEEFGETVTRAVLQARSKAQLRDGIPVPNQKRRMRTFDLDHFDKHEDEAQKEHASLLEGMRDGTIDRPDPMKWAGWILHQHRFKPYDDDCQKLVASLDAAYRYSLALSKFTNNKNYNFQKPGNITAWGDTFQLFYLCDEQMHFLTADKDFRDYVKGSPQANRVLLYKDFVTSVTR